MDGERIKVIDLFSGLGGWSAAFKDRGHEVFTVDIDPKFKPDLVADIMEVRACDLPISPDVVLASPPCNCFSTASLGRYWRDGRPTDHNALEAIGVVMKTLWLIKRAKPRYWALENPRANLRNVIGKPHITTYFAAWGVDRYKPTDLWGRLPRMTWPKPKNWKSPDPKRPFAQQHSTPEEVAMIPNGLSLALCLAIEKELSHIMQESESK